MVKEAFIFILRKNMLTYLRVNVMMRTVTRVRKCVCGFRKRQGMLTHKVQMLKQMEQNSTLGESL